jgi:hypothetical protein
MKGSFNVFDDETFGNIPIIILAEFCFALSTMITKNVVRFFAVQAVEITIFLPSKLPKRSLARLT